MVLSAPRHSHQSRRSAKLRECCLYARRHGNPNYSGVPGGGPWPWLESYVRAQKAAVWIERQSFQKSLKPDPAQAPCSEPSRQSTCGQDSVGSTGCPAHRWLTCCDAALAAACSAAFAASRPDRLSAAFAAATSRSIVLGFTPTALAILRLLICGSAALNQRGVALARSGASAAPG